MSQTLELRETARISLLFPEPFNFRLTVAKPAGWHWSTPKEIYQDNTLWSGLYITGKPIGLKLRAGRRRVTMVTYGESDLTGEEKNILRTVVSNGLGFDEDLEGFYKFAKGDPVLSITTKDLYGMRVGRIDDIFGRIILAILLQMAPLARSEQMMNSLLEQFGNTIFFDNRHVTLWPQSRDIAKATEAELMDRAKLGYRAKRLIQAGQYISNHPLSLMELSKMGEAQALRKLLEIPGIGKYSAGIIWGRSSVPVDVWSVVVLSELILKRTPENPRKEVEKLNDLLRTRWGKWGWLAFAYILNDLEHLSQIYPLTRIR